MSIGIAYNHYPVHGDVTGVINSQAYGIQNRYTPLTVQLPESQSVLEIGMRHVVQSSWNPVGGIRDTYSHYIWHLLQDSSFARNPHTFELLDSRASTTSIETAGPDGKIPVPADAIALDDNGRWVGVPASVMATSKVTFDIEFANWHNGQPMDLNDLLYPIVFDEEYDDGAEQIESRFVAIRVLDDSTVEVYIDYWHHDKHQIALEAALWPQVPWEVHYAMNLAVNAGVADWKRDVASSNSGNWIDMLDSDDAELIRTHLEAAGASDGAANVPDFIHVNKTSEYINARYDATLEWISDKGHVAIGNGPFYLSGPIIRDAGGDITSMTITQFDDPTYPFGPEKWESFVTFEPFAGDVTVGALAPVSGNAHRYGEEIRAATDFAVSDFNTYLEMRGLDWRLATHNLDTATSPDVALSHLEGLRQDGIGLVLGPSIDIITRDIVTYADTNDMLLLSCCSSVPSLAIPDDSLFRMLPDQRMHAGAIVDLLTHHDVGITHIIPVGIDGAWATELLESAMAQFESSGGTSSDVIIYTNPLRDGLAGRTDAQSIQDGEVNIDDAASILAETVARAADQHGPSNVAVLYIGFGEGPEFLKAASEHDALYDVRWFGADQNTASPNIADDPTSAYFARTVGLVTVQPAAHTYMRDSAIQ